MVERRTKWSRRCPDCGTEFASVQSWGICPECELRFSVDDHGNSLGPGTRPTDRASGISLSEPTRRLIAKLFSKSAGAVISDMLYRAVSRSIPFCADETPAGMERIRFAILKLTKESPLNLAVGIHMAQTDWRDLLMAAGFGNDAAEHLRWFDEQMKADG